MPSRAQALVLWCQDATRLKRFHGGMTWAWLMISIPAVLLWKQSVPFLVFVSVYANVVGHFSSWQAARVEVKQVTAEQV